jgi:hypothetical protein
MELKAASSSAEASVPEQAPAVPKSPSKPSPPSPPTRPDPPSSIPKPNPLPAQPAPPAVPPKPRYLAPCGSDTPVPAIFLHFHATASSLLHCLCLADALVCCERSASPEEVRVIPCDPRDLLCVDRATDTRRRPNDPSRPCPLPRAPTPTHATASLCIPVLQLPLRISHRHRRS